MGWDPGGPKRMLDGFLVLGGAVYYGHCACHFEKKFLTQCKRALQQAMSLFWLMKVCLLVCGCPVAHN